MSDENEQAAAAKQRLEVLVEAFDVDPDDQEAMEELFIAKHRLSEQVARAITARSDLHSRVGGYIPERRDGGPATAEEAIEWDLCVRYEVTANLLEVYVDDERILTDAVSNLRQDARFN
jgi:hypothetical protein